MIIIVISGNRRTGRGTQALDWNIPRDICLCKPVPLRLLQKLKFLPDSNDFNVV